MASALWGKAYFHDSFAGLLQQEPGGRCVFSYDPAYLAARHAAPIAHSLPLRVEPFRSESGLHAFFDNLVAEGWLKNLQARALGVDPDNRFALLLAFGRDLAGAVSIIDPAPRGDLRLDPRDPEAMAALASRASLSGIQRKLLLVADERGYRPAGPEELSTHIGKLPSGTLRDIVPLEFLTTLAVRALLPGDPTVEFEIAAIRGIAEPALVVRRFDRAPSGRKLHFEEFSQLLGRRSGDDKYAAGYEDMGRFIHDTPGCLAAETYRLYRRVLACLLVGNTDAHLKNFAMFHTRDGLRLTPSYDQVASALYPEFQTIALAIGGAPNLSLGALQPKHVVALGEGFGMNDQAILAAVTDIGGRLEAALEAVSAAAAVERPLKDELIERMRKRWNGSFASTGRLLSKRRGKGARRRSLRNRG